MGLYFSYENKTDIDEICIKIKNQLNIDIIMVVQTDDILKFELLMDKIYCKSNRCSMMIRIGQFAVFHDAIQIFKRFLELCTKNEFLGVFNYDGKIYLSPINLIEYKGHGNYFPNTLFMNMIFNSKHCNKTFMESYTDRGPKLINIFYTFGDDKIKNHIEDHLMKREKKSYFLFL